MTKPKTKIKTTSTTSSKKRTASKKAVANVGSFHIKDKFPIVGIGASAGGLEALELFLANVPENSGMAFVIVQHLDPTHKGVMVELLQRGTRMKVVQVRDRMRVEPNCVYIIPPNKDMSILHGVLHLLVPVAPRGLRLPIDFFLRSLADDQQERSVGVILSGMGSDGSLGLRTIKEKMGAVFVQDPATARTARPSASSCQSSCAESMGQSLTRRVHLAHDLSHPVESIIVPDRRPSIGTQNFPATVTLLPFPSSRIDHGNPQLLVCQEAARIGQEAEESREAAASRQQRKAGRRRRPGVDEDATSGLNPLPAPHAGDHLVAAESSPTANHRRCPLRLVRFRPMAFAGSTANLIAWIRALL